MRYSSFIYRNGRHNVYELDISNSYNIYKFNEIEAWTPPHVLIFKHNILIILIRIFTITITR